MEIIYDATYEEKCDRTKEFLICLVHVAKNKTIFIYKYLNSIFLPTSMKLNLSVS